MDEVAVIDAMVGFLAVASAVGLALVARALATPVDGRGRAEVAAIVVLGLGALALHLAVPWSPYDLNLRHARAWNPEIGATTMYGFGTEALGVVMQGLWPGTWSSRLLADAMAAVSAVHVVLLALWVRLLGASAPVAWLAGALLAVQPAHARFAHTDVQTQAETLWTLGALVLAWRHGRAPSWVDGLGAGLLLGLVAHARPESLVVVPALAVLAAVTVPRSVWRHPATLAGVAVAGAVAALQLPVVLHHAGPTGQSPDAIANPLRPDRHPLSAHGLAHLLAIDPAFTPPPVAALALALPWARGVAPRVAWAVLAVALGALVLVAGDPSWTPIGGAQFGFARHQLRALPFVAAVQAFGASAALAAVGPRAAWAGAVGVLAVATWTLPLAFVLRTGPSEVRFLVEHAAALPRPCQLTVPGFEADAGLKVSPELVEMTGITLATPGDGAPAEGCWAYWRPAECSLDPAVFASTPEEPGCDAFEAAHTLTPVAEAWLDTEPWIYDRLHVRPARIGLYRVDGR